MHRMCYHFGKLALTLIVLQALATVAVAELIQSPGGRAYPDLAAAITGQQNYSYDAATGSGSFQVTNTPFLLTTSPSQAGESIVQPDTAGVRTQIVNLTLDQNGRLLGSASNVYALYGTVNIRGQTFSGLLLSATPTSFGAQGGTSAAFNLDLKVTGGVLAPTFGSDLYMVLHPTLNSEFDGSFTKSFSTTIESSNTLGYNAPRAVPAPEPTTLVVLLAFGAVVVVRHVRRRFRLEMIGRGDVTVQRGHEPDRGEGSLRSIAPDAQATISYHPRASVCLDASVSSH